MTEARGHSLSTSFSGEGCHHTDYDNSNRVLTAHDL